MIKTAAAAEEGNMKHLLFFGDHMNFLEVTGRACADAMQELQT